jgi:hypothetical protein
MIMITLKGTKPVQWAKSYHVDTIEKAKEKHQEMYPDYIIEEAIEEENIYGRRYL